MKQKSSLLVCIIFALLFSVASMGNARATLCNDGWDSPSIGQGTCSHHGGEIGQDSVYYGPKKVIPLETLVYLQSECYSGLKEDQQKYNDQILIFKNEKNQEKKRFDAQIALLHYSYILQNKKSAEACERKILQVYIGSTANTQSSSSSAPGTDLTAQIVVYGIIFPLGFYFIYRILKRNRK